MKRVKTEKNGCLKLGPLCVLNDVQLLDGKAYGLVGLLTFQILYFLGCILYIRFVVVTVLVSTHLLS